MVDVSGVGFSCLYCTGWRCCAEYIRAAGTSTSEYGWEWGNDRGAQIVGTAGAFAVTAYAAFAAGESGVLAFADHHDPLLELVVYRERYHLSVSDGGDRSGSESEEDQDQDRDYPTQADLCEWCDVGRDQ